ncbi:hypothetical protein A2U01_0106727, partial [Trifolium medium]|nr:hypothetical protein [Trifolium medium]
MSLEKATIYSAAEQGIDFADGGGVLALVRQQ